MKRFKRRHPNPANPKKNGFFLLHNGIDRIVMQKLLYFSVLPNTEKRKKLLMTLTLGKVIPYHNIFLPTGSRERGGKRNIHVFSTLFKCWQCATREGSNSKI